MTSTSKRAYGHRRRPTNVRICVEREAESGWLVAVTRIKVVRVGIHLVLEDAVRGSARRIADDEHAPTGGFYPDGIGPVGGSFGGRPARPAAGSSPLLPAHSGHLHQFHGHLHQLALPRPVYRVMAAAGTRNVSGRTHRAASRASPSGRCRIRRHQTRRGTGEGPVFRRAAHPLVIEKIRVWIASNRRDQR
jgi:hypothetical protein